LSLNSERATSCWLVAVHQKFAVIDARWLLNGSFNYTRQAVLSNQENVLVLDSPTIAGVYGQHFERLWAKYA